MVRNTSFSSNTSFNGKIFVCEYLKIRIIVVTGKLHMISLMFTIPSQSINTYHSPPSSALQMIYIVNNINCIIIYLFKHKSKIIY